MQWNTSHSDRVFAQPMPPLTQAWQVFHSLLTPLYFLFAYGRSGLRPSLVQGLRPRNAPVQNQSRRGASVCVIATITPRRPSTPAGQPPPRRQVLDASLTRRNRQKQARPARTASPAAASPADRHASQPGKPARPGSPRMYPKLVPNPLDSTGGRVGYSVDDLPHSRPQPMYIYPFTHLSIYTFVHLHIVTF